MHSTTELQARRAQARYRRRRAQGTARVLAWVALALVAWIAAGLVAEGAARGVAAEAHGATVAPPAPALPDGTTRTCATVDTGSNVVTFGGDRYRYRDAGERITFAKGTPRMARVLALATMDVKRDHAGRGPWTGATCTVLNLGPVS